MDRQMMPNSVRYPKQQLPRLELRGVLEVQQPRDWAIRRYYFQRGGMRLYSQVLKHISGTICQYAGSIAVRTR